MRAFLGAVLFVVAGAALAGGYEDQRSRDIHIQAQKAKSMAKAEGAASVTNANPVDVDAAAVAPNPSAHAPSAQCRYGWSVTGAGVGFGAGISASEWDEICGLWMAAQQTTGPARDEAAAAAYCLTMKKARVHSPTCDKWNQGQGVAKVDMNGNRATVAFTGVGTAVAVRDPTDGP